jgi:rhodanese-related sulfurtransferase
MTNSFDAPANAPEPRRIGPDQAHAASAAGRAVLLDVRDERLFDNAHIDPAVALPLAELEGGAGRLPGRIVIPGNALVILYCA